MLLKLRRKRKTVTIFLTKYSNLYSRIYIAIIILT